MTWKWVTKPAEGSYFAWSLPLLAWYTDELTFKSEVERAFLLALPCCIFFLFFRHPLPFPLILIPPSSSQWLVSEVCFENHPWIVSSCGTCNKWPEELPESCWCTTPPCFRCAFVEYWNNLLVPSFDMYNIFQSKKDLSDILPKSVSHKLKIPASFPPHTNY